MLRGQALPSQRIEGHELTTRHTETFIESSDGTKLYSQAWLPEGDPKGVIALVHGSGEHCGRYSRVVEYFLPRSYSVLGFDFRGHGKSAGRPGHVNSWREYREDLDAFIQFAKSSYPSQKLFLYSHSMGGQISLDYLIQKGASGIAAAVVSAPAIAQPDISSSLRLLGNIVSTILPRTLFSNGLDVNDISRDPAVIEAYRSDPLVRSKLSARAATELLAAIDRVQAGAEKIELPIFLFHGEKDRIMSSSGTQTFFDKLFVENKQLKIYSGGFHEPHNDLQSEEVFRDVEDWLLRYL